MLSKEALDRVIDALHMGGLDPNQSSAPIVALPNTVNIHSLEKYRAGRDRFRLNFRAGSFSAFIEYLGAQYRGETEELVPVWVDADAMAASCILDLGTEAAPGHCEHVARLTLKKSRVFQAIEAICKTPISQTALCDFLEDWRGYWTARSGSDVEIEESAAMQAIRKIDIRSSSETRTDVQHMSEGRSVLSRVEATSLSGLAARFDFECEPYLPLGEIHIALALGIAAVDDKAPVLRLRFVAEESTREHLAVRFCDQLIQDLHARYRPLLGTVEV